MCLLCANTLSGMTEDIYLPIVLHWRQHGRVKRSGKSDIHDLERRQLKLNSSVMTSLVMKRGPVKKGSQVMTENNKQRCLYGGLKFAYKRWYRSRCAVGSSESCPPRGTLRWLIRRYICRCSFSCLTRLICSCVGFRSTSG